VASAAGTGVRPGRKREKLPGVVLPRLLDPPAGCGRAAGTAVRTVRKREEAPGVLVLPVLLDPLGVVVLSGRVEAPPRRGCCWVIGCGRAAGKRSSARRGSLRSLLKIRQHP